MHPTRSDIGAYIKAVKTIEAQSVAAGGTATGDGVDRLGADSGTIAVDFGTLTGGPVTALSVTIRLEDSEDDATYATLVDRNGDDVSVTLTGADQTASEAILDAVQELDFDLAGARQYVRAVVVVTTITGATAVLLCAMLVLGGGAELPQA